MAPNLKGLLKTIAGPAYRKYMLSRLSPEDRALVARVRGERLTYLSDRKVVSLMNTCRAIERDELPGIFVEAGCALGGSAILIASLKRPDRPFNVYDVFGMIPPPTEEDTPDVHDRYQEIAEGKSEGIDGDTYYGYEENLYETVRSNLERFGITGETHAVALIRGLVQDTMTIDEPVAFAHVDVDWYDPVMTCLTRIFPKLVVGGSIILDDYRNWGGCRKATDEYLRGVTGQFALDGSGGSMKVTRIQS